MTTLFLLRHATHDHLGNFLAGRMDGIHLGEMGKAEAERVGQRLRREQVSAVYSSPQPRARETAEIVARALSIRALNGPSNNSANSFTISPLLNTQAGEFPRPAINCTS